MPLTTEETPSDTVLRDAVLAELAEFRRRDGIDVRKIRDSGAHVMRLPAVERSASERQVPRDVAAMEYLRCIAGRPRDLGNEYQRIVWATLNFDGEASSLTQRRDALRGFRKESAFLEFEKAAFENYAGQLVWRRASPCEDSTAERESLALATALLTASYDQDAIDLLTLVLTKLRRSRTEDETREHARRLIETLPLGLRVMGMEDFSDAGKVISTSEQLLMGAMTYATLQNWTLSPKEFDSEFVKRQDLYLLGAWGLHRTDHKPIVARTAIWLEQSMSWHLIFESPYEDARRLQPTP